MWMRMAVSGCACGWYQGIKASRCLDRRRNSKSKQDAATATDVTLHVRLGRKEVGAISAKAKTLQLTCKKWSKVGIYMLWV